MNSTILDLQFTPLEEGLISDADFLLSQDTLASIMFVVSFVGVVTNSINVRTFIAMGLNDGITVCLMGLAISDLGFTFFGCILSSANIINSIEKRYGLENLPIHPKYVFGMFSANIAFMFHLVTCMTTMFMAIARCMCVAMPFKFKDYFTKSRSMLALGIFNLLAAACYLPVLSQMGVQRKFDPQVNRTRIVLWMSNLRSDIKSIVSTFHYVVLVFVSSIVVGICIVIMAKHLRESVRFRQASSFSEVEGKEGTGKSDGKLSGKELRVLQQVIVICIIYIVSLVPAICFVITGLFEKDFDLGQRLHNLYMTTSSISTIYELSNSATTFPVYYVFNSKFRSMCFSLRGSDKKDFK